MVQPDGLSCEPEVGKPKIHTGDRMARKEFRQRNTLSKKKGPTGALEYNVIGPELSQNIRSQSRMYRLARGLRKTKTQKSKRTDLRDKKNFFGGGDAISKLSDRKEKKNPV